MVDLKTFKAEFITTWANYIFWNAIYEKSGRWHGPILFLWVRKKNHAVALWTWMDFFFFDWTSISLLQCQGKWLPNGKNKKEKKMEKKIVMSEKKNNFMVRQSWGEFFSIVMFLFCRTRKIEIDIFWHVDREMILTEFLAIFSDFKAIYMYFTPSAYLFFFHQ